MRLAHLGTSPAHSGQEDIVSSSTYRLLFSGHLGGPHHPVHPRRDWDALSVLERPGRGLLLRNSEGASARIRLIIWQKPSLSDSELAGVIEALRPTIAYLLGPISSESGSV